MANKEKFLKLVSDSEDGDKTMEEVRERIEKRKQTAMKQMVNYLEEMKSKTTDPSETYMLIDAWVHAVHLLQAEKDQLSEAMMYALDEDGHTGEWKLKFVEKYYNDKYNK